jgi:extradiol dioxygenase family protein
MGMPVIISTRIFTGKQTEASTFFYTAMTGNALGVKNRPDIGIENY